ncbi:hypothetical protein HPULCUR_008659 [Helicostylum pulchrum]|uniref:DNA2/NAM7 helicase helicase domain-containing protein n=1 Tax=Helicostylum pulchrum TaxID=562976 RepID=A0ABP9Y9A7_9FUNG
MSEALEKLNSLLGVSIEYNAFFSSLCFPIIRPLDEINFIGQDLDKSQIEATEFSIGPNKISLIHGPPGVSDVYSNQQLVENQKLRLLVCAPSNNAVDNILRRIMNITSEELKYDKFEYTKISRTTRPGMDRLSKLMESMSIDKLATISVEKTCYQHGKSPAVLIKEADVVFCTLNGSGSVLMEDENFDVVIIDEAGQATEPDCWIALLKAKRAILCGDHLQLSPTVISQPVSVQDPRPKGSSTLNDLSYTMFDRLMDMQGKKNQTDFNYAVPNA